MAGIILEGKSMKRPMDFYVEFFGKAGNLLPDYGGRNLDALHDSLRELHEPLTVVWRGFPVSYAGFGMTSIETTRLAAPRAMAAD